MDAIVINSLTKVYGTTLAVDHIDLTIQKGEIMGLLGPNGAGKTTTLMILSTLLKPTLGTAIVNGFDVLAKPAQVRASIGMVFQDPSSDELLTAYENLKLHALMYDVPMRAIDKKINEVLSLVGLQERQHDKVKTYSGGMRRRMEIARGLLHEPKVLFLDEPTLGLDPQTREHIWVYIERLSKDTGMTIVLTTHYMEEAERLCHRVAIIDNGKIIALDTPAALCESLGGDMVFINGKNLQPQELAKLPFVRKIETLDHGLRIAVEDSAKNLQKLLQTAGETEFVTVHLPDLNDVFLHYTGKGIREAQGSVMEHIRAFSKARQNN